MTILPALSESQIAELEEQIRLGSFRPMPIMLSGDHPGVSIKFIDKAKIRELFEEIIRDYRNMASIGENEGLIDAGGVNEDVAEWRQRLGALLGQGVSGERA